MMNGMIYGTLADRIANRGFYAWTKGMDDKQQSLREVG